MAIQIPIYSALLKENVDGIWAISLVDDPAVERDFVCFSKDKEMQKFSISNEDKHLVTGVVMLADTPIYRREGDFEYYLIFSKETIREMAERMLQNGTQNNIDIQHDGELISGVNMVELFIKDDAKGINPNFIEDIPDGSLLATFHVSDEDLWQKLHTDEINGFSLEGFFSYTKIDFNKQNNNSNTLMKKTSKIMAKIEQIVKDALMEFNSVATDNAILNWDGEDELKEGVEVYAIDENGEHVAIADGEYKTEDGKIITVAESKVTSIVEKEEETVEPEAEEPEVLEETEEEKVEETEEIKTEEKVEETEPEFDAKAEIEKLFAAIEELKGEIAKVNDEIAALKEAPAAEPIAEEFANIKRTEITASKGVKKAAGILSNLNK